MENVIIYTDGGCIGNPGPGGWGAIVSDGFGGLVELGGAATSTTNNRMEMTAVLEALKSLSTSNPKVEVYSDSKYVLQGISEWRFGWQSRGWTNSQGSEVQNKDIWLPLCDVVDRLTASGVKFHWHYVPGHQGIPGNERVDEIAQKFARKEGVDLYMGDALAYNIDLTPPPPEARKKAGRAPATKGSVKGSNKKPLGYCSFVDGVYRMDKTWKQCEARVKGRRGAKFRKVFNLAEVEDLKAKWGVR